MGLLILALTLGGLPLPQAGAQQNGQNEFQNIAVKPGDTLATLGKKYLKDPAKWDELLRYNRLPSNDPNSALPGMLLRIPIKSVKTEFQAALLVYRINMVFYKRGEGGDWQAAVDNQQVFRNDAIKTFPDSKAGVKFLDGDLMEVGPASMALVMPPTKDYAIELKRGTIVAANKTIKVGTAIIAPANANTVFTATVKADNTTLVQVYKGQAAVSAAGKTVQVGAGKATEIKQGFAPTMAFAVADFKGLGSMVSSFTSKLAALKQAVKEALPVAEVESPADKAEESRDEMMKEAGRIKMLEAVSGYRVECSKTQDFQAVVARKFFEAGTTMHPTDFEVPPGQYWCRMAAVDLLESTGKYREPKQYFLGGKP